MFNFFNKSKKPKNLKELVSKIEKIEEKVDKNSKEIEKIQDNFQLTVQKIGITRFTPFKETGGDQSFAVALLDNNDDGLLLTSIYSRERNRIFAKPIKDGKSKYKLSKEEKETIKKAKELKLKENDKEK